MAEWLVEEGIGEHRAIRPGPHGIAAALLHWPGGLATGQVEDAKLVSKPAGSRRGVVLFANGERAQVDRLPADASEGAAVRVEVTRPKIWEAGRLKLAQTRPSNAPLRPGPSLAEQLALAGEAAHVVRRFDNALGWDELRAEAVEQCVEFAGGSLKLYPTPAMLLIDVDGEPGARLDKLALEAVPSLARTIRRFGLGGNIGVDFPTVPDRSLRREIDARLDGALADWPHERTAMNGFGFVQLVARMERPSLLNLLQSDRAGAHARWLVRKAEALDGPGVSVITAPHDIAAAIAPEWLAELIRRTGRPARVEVDESALAYDLSHVQVLPS